MTTPTDRVTVVCLLVGFVAILAAYVVLALYGVEAGGLVTVVTSVLAALGVAGHVETRTRQQNERIAKIDRQTNGVLDARIHDGTTRAVRAVLREAGLPNVPAPSDPIH